MATGIAKVELASAPDVRYGTVLMTGPRKGPTGPYDRVVAIDPLEPDEATLARAADILRRGGLVAFPTETVYGLGCNALDPEAVSRVYAAKGRPDYNPLIVHVSDLAHANRLSEGWVASWPRHAETLAERFGRALSRWSCLGRTRSRPT